MLGGLGHEGLTCFRERVNRADLRPHDALVDQGTVRPKVDAVYSLADAREAFMAKSTQPIPGKVVLTP